LGIRCREIKRRRQEAKMAAAEAQRAHPCLANVSPPQPSFDVLPRLHALCFRLLVVDGAQPQLLVELRPLGALPATTTLAVMLCRCSRRTFRLVGQLRAKMHRGAANSANPHIGGYR